MFPCLRSRKPLIATFRGLIPATYYPACSYTRHRRERLGFSSVGVGELIPTSSTNLPTVSVDKCRRVAGRIVRPAAVCNTELLQRFST